MKKFLFMTWKRSAIKEVNDWAQIERKKMAYIILKHSSFCGWTKFQIEQTIFHSFHICGFFVHHEQFQYAVSCPKLAKNTIWWILKNLQYGKVFFWQFGDFWTKNGDFGSFWLKSVKLAIFSQKMPMWRFLVNLEPTKPNLAILVAKMEIWRYFT